MSNPVAISEEKVKEIIQRSYDEIKKYENKEIQTKDETAENLTKIVKEVVDAE